MTNGLILVAASLGAMLFVTYYFIKHIADDSTGE